MNSVAAEMFNPSSSPDSCWAAASGSTTPVTVRRVMLSVALPYTTSATLKPTLPPMRNVGSVGPSLMFAEATGF